MDELLPAPFTTWFTRHGWQPHAHQLAMLEAAARGASTLLVAPTGGGKTLAGFLPSLVELASMPSSARHGIHTLYISPLKALAVDIARNLTRPVEEMDLPIRIDARTGDTSASQRQKQRKTPPDILLTTPESLALMLSYPDAGEIFAGLRAIILDEVHALHGNKRGDHLALCLGRLARLTPTARRVGLSATVADPDAVAAYIAPGGDPGRVERINARAGAPPEVHLLLPSGDRSTRDWYLPWSGHMGVGSTRAILAAIASARLTIVFVNTRAQAELIFQGLWKYNEDTLPIGLHHGSLQSTQRQRVEQAMAEGTLRAVVATASLDLGIDWAGVDQIIQVGAPKSVSRLLQRIGRANHRLDEPSRAVLVPANRFEVLECVAAREGVAAMDLDGPMPRAGGLDILAQHILGMACSAPFMPDDLYDEVRDTSPYATLSRKDFDDVLRYVEDGGYALQAYDRHRRLIRDSLGQMWVRNERIMRQYRMNIGTIVETPMLRVRLRRGPALGEIEESFASQLVVGDTFVFGGQLVCFHGLRDMVVEVTQGGSGDPRIPVYGGSWMPLANNLARRVRGLIHDSAEWDILPQPVHDWLAMQQRRSRLPDRHGLLVETFPRGDRWYLVAYCFEGRNAHQTLGMLLTRRMARFGYGPLGFVATDYVLAAWSIREPTDISALFSQDMLGEDLEEWTVESSMMRRMFRNVAVIAGLVERNLPSRQKNRRQVTMSTDLLYDVLRRHQPDHVLIRATWADAATGMTDLGRLSAMLADAYGNIMHMRLDRVSPLAVPIMLELGREKVGAGDSEDELMAEAESLLAEASADAPSIPLPKPARKRKIQA